VYKSPSYTLSKPYMPRLVGEATLLKDSYADNTEGLEKVILL
jgi:hypothetical protein